MVRVVIKDNYVSAKGHTLPDICASVSTAFTFTVNVLTELYGQSSINYKLDSGDAYIEIKHKDNNDMYTILNVLKNALQDLEEEFEGCIQITKI